MGKKPNNYWTLVTCTQAALPFKHRSDFQREVKGAYIKCVREGWLDTVCAHMVSKPYKKPKSGLAAHNRVDLTGQVFGNWTVLRFHRFPGQTAAAWECRCQCGNTRVIPGVNLKQGLSTKCKTCSNQISAPMRKIHAYIKSLGIEANLSDKTFGREFDIVVHSHKLIIEYDGLLWHSDKFRTNVSTECRRFLDVQATGYNWFRIYEDEFKASEELIMAMIAHRLGIRPATRAAPNEIEVRLIEQPRLYRKFFEENHIDGYGACQVGFGVFLGEVPLSIMTFRRYNKGRFSGQIELARFCSNYKYDTYGYFSKCLKAAKKHFAGQAQYIVSASDNRFSVGKVYANNGFTLNPEPRLQLNYYYYLHSRGRRVHRFQCRKLYPPQISETQYAQYPTEAAQTASGLMAQVKFGKWEPLHKIWGWGNKLWVLKLKS